MINKLSEVHIKLDAFIGKYYKNQIIRGSLLWVLLALIFYILLVSGEFLGHFSINTRTLLFYSALFFLVISFAFLIVKPLLAFYKLTSGIDKYQANEILRLHFPELKDQLKNILELETMQDSSYSIELIESAIRQKSESIRPISFVKAIKTKANFKYIKIIFLPVLVLLSLYFFLPKVLSEGTERILNYNQFYEKPSAFTFVIENDSLSVKRGEDLNLIIHSEGEYIPYPIYVQYGGVEYLLQKKEENLFSYEFKNINQDFIFYLKAEDYQSRAFNIEVLPTPKILDFKVTVLAPKYTQIPKQTYANNGDFIAPEGSAIEWVFKTKDIDKLWLNLNDSLAPAISQKQNFFTYETKLNQNLEYSINIENQRFKEVEVLKYLAQIIPDEYPSVNVLSVIDSLNPTVFYFRGQANDDYGIQKINFCYQSEENSKIKLIQIPSDNKEALQEFYYAFDFKEVAKQGEKLNYYFEVWDNDVVNGSKKSVSQVYQFYLPTQKEIDKIQDEKSESMQNKLEQTQDLAKELQEDVKNLKRDLIEKEANSWQVNKKLAQIAEKQNKLEQLMEEVAKENEKTNELLKNLTKEDKELIEKQKQIEDLLSQLMDEEMKKLMEEINKLMEEFNKDEFNELTEKMEMSYEDLSEQLDRNLEQLKRFEVEKKMLQSADELEKLAEEHKQLSEETKKGSESKESLEQKQKEHQEKMDDIADKVKDAMEKNKDLEEPMDLQDMAEQMEQIKESMQESSESLQKGKSGKASKQQKSSAEQMQQMAMQMKKMMEKAGQEQQQQDMDALRQIIENLSSFSFEQEELMLGFRGLRYKDPKYIELFNQQTKVQSNFELIKDSLHALAMTQPMIAAPINKELLNIERELNKTEKALDDRRAGKAQSSQQLVMTSANNLALLLSEILDQMQQQQSQSKCQKSGDCQKPGSGKPKPGFGKPKKQAQSLKNQMQSMLDQLKDGKKGKGKGKGGTKPSKGELGKMIAEQEKMQKMLSDLANSQGISPKTAKKLKEIKNISEQVENDLIQQNITPTTLKRQELILTRLLEAENSEFKREQDNKRESNTVKNQRLSNPKEIFNKDKESLIGNDVLNKSKVKLKQFYKEKYNRYILNINE